MEYCYSELETKLEAIAAANEYANNLNKDDYDIIVEKDYNLKGYNENFDVALIIKNKNKNRTIGVKSGIYLFDVVNLRLQLRHPELIKLITGKCFRRIDPLGGEIDVKEKYKETPYVALPSSPLMAEQYCIPLDETLIKVCKRTYKFEGRYINNEMVYYCVLGCNAFESLEKRIDNKIGTGRCDREVSPVGCTGPCPEDTASKILKESHKFSVRQIKTVRVYCGKGKWRCFIGD